MFLAKQKSKKESKLIKAYKTAANPPDLKTLAEEIEKLRQEQEEDDEEDDEEESGDEDEDDEEEVEEEAAEDDEDESETEKKPVRKAKGKPKAQPKPATTKETVKSRSLRASARNARVSEREEDVNMAEVKHAPKEIKRKSSTITSKPDKTEAPNPPSRKRAKTISKSTTTSSPNGNSSPTPSTVSSPAPNGREHADMTSQRTKILKSIRHRLQRGFIVETPTSVELPDLSRYITRLEEIPDLEVSVMRETKIKKVLTAISRLKNIPQEKEYQFKERIGRILDAWNRNEQNAMAESATS